ncbi:MAG TPA: pantetheine-phosphate adenylyltransferase [Membranihabitans sp.]|nr:pantetheine-phosphate adenylyltransferase [Membranihabitans sp.]
MKIAVFPGSFDPITTGHTDIVYRVLPLFDKIVVAIGVNDNKKTLFPLEQRMGWLKEVFRDEEQIVVDYFQGLTVDYCRKIGAHFLVRGLRSAADFDYEKTISQVNTTIGDKLETVFLISQPKYSHISSTIVREIIKAGGNASQFLPPEIKIP